jgi:Amidohydrolase family
VASYNPWVSLAWLVTGTTVGGLRLYPQRNCLDRETALRMWTENVTWFSNEEGTKGQIKVGQLADLVVPDRDYFSCPESEIADITADLTVVGGKVVYGAGAFANLDEAPPPPAMPDWSPVRRFGGYAAWTDRERPRTAATMRRTVSPSAHAHAGHVHDFTCLWGALGCACWAV